MDACEIANFLASELFMQQVNRQTDRQTNEQNTCHLSITPSSFLPHQPTNQLSISTQMKIEEIVDHQI